MHATDVMTTRYMTLKPDNTITDVVTIAPQTHLLTILDVMIKRHIRRLPVVREQEVVGIVYISDLFYHLLQQYLA